MRLKIGAAAPPVSMASIHGQPIRIPNAAARYVHLQFQRFAGCPACNFRLLTLSKRLPEIQAAGIHEVVVFHSSVEEMMNYQAQLPFDCIADPTKSLYREYGVEVAWFALLHPSVLWGGFRGILATGKFYKRAENGIFGLPADFLIRPNGQIAAVHYGSHAYDNWDVDAILQLAT